MNPPNHASIALEFYSREEIIPVFKEGMTQLARQAGIDLLSGQFYHDMQISFVEGVANAIVHANELEHFDSVHARLLVQDGSIQIEIDDHGPGYSLENVPMPNFELMSESGRGIFMIRQLMDDVEFVRKENINTLVMRRHLIGQDPEARTLDLLYQISDAILSSTDIETIYNIILDKALEVFEVERASILVFDNEQKCLKVVASRGMNQELQSKVQIRPGEGVAGYVYQHAKPCLIEDMNANHSGWQAQNQYKSRSFISAPMICSPMRVGQQSIGVINLTDRSDGRPFTKKDLKLLTTIANQASAYVHIVKLLSQAKEAEFFRRELDIARKIQVSYLPPRSPVWQGFDIAGWCQMAQSVGGDYYDFLDADSCKYVIVADVSGHNIAAALTMASLRSQLKGLIHQLQDPGEILSRLNCLLYEELSKNDQFISMVLIQIDPKSKVLKMANAGHCDPCVLDKNGAVKMAGESLRGTVMGVFPSEVYQTSDVKMTKKSSMLIYTDGIVECKNSKGDFYGTKRLIKLMERQVGKKSEEYLKDLAAHFKRFTKDTVVMDDATAVVIST